MITPRLRLFVCAAAVVVAIFGCAGDSTVRPSDPFAASASAADKERTLAIALTRGESSSAGMILSIEGPNIVGIAPASGLQLVAAPAESNGRDRIDVLVTGPVQIGVIAWLTVKGVNSGHPYDATITQVAAGPDQGFVQRDPSAYTVVVQR